jgi:hypothetical protein
MQVEELEQRLERLRALYEQYFLGLEKIEPAVAQKDVDRRIWVLRRVQVRNSVMRFRLQALIQRYNTYQQHWVRICREIENGTFKRLLRRTNEKPALTIAARRRNRNVTADGKDTQQADDASEVTPTLPPKVAARTPEEATAETGAAPGARKLPAIPGAGAKPLPAIPGLAAAKGPSRSGSEAGRVPIPKPPIPGETNAAAANRAPGGDGVLPPRPSPPRVGAKPPPPPSAVKSGTSGGALSEQRIKELHAELAREKKKLAEPASVSLDGLTKRLRDAEAKLQQQHRGKNVDFRVVVEGGKAVVKPVLR